MDALLQACCLDPCPTGRPGSKRPQGGVHARPRAMPARHCATRPIIVGLSHDDRLDIWLRDGGVCQRCGARGTDIHHRIARGMGGTKWKHANDPILCITLCRPCHTWIETHRDEAYDQNWLLHRSEWETIIEQGGELPEPRR